MKRIVLIITILFSLFTLADVDTFHGSLKNLDESKIWQEGEIKPVLIQIYPLQDVSISDIRSKLESSDFCDFFYIGKIESISFSKNNPVVLEVKADMTLKKYFNTSKPLIWSYLALNIPINLENMELKIQEEKIQEYITLNVQRHFENTNWLIITLIIILLIITLIYFKVRKKKSSGRSVDAEVRALIVKASSRKEYEEIYAKRGQIEKIFGKGSPAFNNLFQVIDKHQFKKEWNEDDLYEINFILDEIKESLKNG